MKPIQLTKEQQDYLIEMCKALYPYSDVRLIKPMYSLPDSFSIQMSSKTDKFWSGEIPWFEFCMTTLAEKVIATYQINKDDKKVYSKMLNEDLSKFYLELLEFSRGITTTHPVDYLYKQFKINHDSYI